MASPTEVVPVLVDTAPSPVAAAVAAAAVTERAAAEGSPSTLSPNVHLMDAARDAFAAHNLSASKAVHDAKAAGVKSVAAEVHGGTAAGFIKSICFGALDGLITEFAIGNYALPRRGRCWLRHATRSARLAAIPTP